jgi:hypothetical protein
MEHGRDRLGCEPETSQAETLDTLTDVAGIAMLGCPVSFDVGPHDALDRQRLTVGIDAAE